MRPKLNRVQKLIRTKENKPGSWQDLDLSQKKAVSCAVSKTQAVADQGVFDITGGPNFDLKITATTQIC